MGTDWAWGFCLVLCCAVPLVSRGERGVRRVAVLDQVNFSEFSIVFGERIAVGGFPAERSGAKRSVSGWDLGVFEGFCRWLGGFGSGFFFPWGMVDGIGGLELGWNGGCIWVEGGLAGVIWRGRGLGRGEEGFRGPGW